jgi:SAM-dependent methyltransferase
VLQMQSHTAASISFCSSGKQCLETDDLLTTRCHNIAVRSAYDDWDAHWSDYAVAAERNPAQRYRRSLALRLLERQSTPQRLLDIGCGQGDFLLAAATRWPLAKLVGLEGSAHGNEIGREKVPACRFVDVDLTRAHTPPSDLAGWATHAVCSEVLEHVDDAPALLRVARGYLSPGARVVVTVPGGPMSAFDRRIGHRRHYTPHDLLDTFVEAGLRVTMVTGAGFPFFTLYRRLIIARGERLAADISTGSSGGESPRLAARAAMLAFRPFLPLSLPRSPWGTQILGVAYEPH